MKINFDDYKEIDNYIDSNNAVIESNFKDITKLMIKIIDKKNINLYIYGIAGVGKTEFLKKLIKLINKNEMTFTFINVVDFIQTAQRNWSSSVKESLDIKGAAQSEFLLIDDIGAEFFHETTYPYLYNLFHQRYEFISSSQKNTSTIIVSNLNFEKLKEKYAKVGDVAASRLISRLSGIIDHEIKFEGEDKRLIKNI